ncbi:MAG: galactosyldiacylglycerol synthase [Acidobacteriia bacterium 12-62-4]|nr:MAG: galactosyldiacylglycerol synthase [Acidobacteriia bacterium 12-62-4]
MSKRPLIHFLFFDAGGGHRAAATALQQVITSQERPWDIELIDLQDVLDELDIFRKLTGLRLEEIYNHLLAKGWTLGSAQLLPLMHGIIRIYHRAQVRVLTRYWTENRPDLVVSLVPNFNRAMFQALRAADPAVPYVTILTDMADYPPHFWIENQRQTFVCGTDTAAEQARAAAAPGADNHRVSGMILHPRFYEVPPVDRADTLRQYGLEPGIPTGLVLFGGEGSSKMLEIYDRIDASPLNVQLLLLCGKNEKLAAKLRARQGRIRKHVEGFTRQVPAFMQVADFFIGKPGPGSVSEAIQMGLPVIVEKNAWTLPQERFNADWVKQQGVGESLSSFSQLVPALERMLVPETFEKLRGRVAAIENRAIFEIPEILAKLLPPPHTMQK